MKTIEDTLEDHVQQFREMPQKYVPRGELGEALNGIRASLARSEDLLMRILLKRAGLHTTEDDAK